MVTFLEPSTPPTHNHPTLNPLNTATTLSPYSSPCVSQTDLPALFRCPNAGPLSRRSSFVTFTSPPMSPSTFPAAPVYEYPPFLSSPTDNTSSHSHTSSTSSGYTLPPPTYGTINTRFTKLRCGACHELKGIVVVDLPCEHTLCIACLKLRFDVALKMKDGVVCCCGHMLGVEVAEKVVGRKRAEVYRDRIEGGYPKAKKGAMGVKSKGEKLKTVWRKAVGGLFRRASEASQRGGVEQHSPAVKVC